MLPALSDGLESLEYGWNRIYMYTRISCRYANEDPQSNQILYIYIYITGSIIHNDRICLPIVREKYQKARKWSASKFGPKGWSALCTGPTGYRLHF